MQTSAISSAALTGADTDALLRLIESIRAEKTGGVSNADIVSKIATPESAAGDAAPGAIMTDDASAAASLPTLGRYVNIWA